MSYARYTVVLSEKNDRDIIDFIESHRRKIGITKLFRNLVLDEMEREKNALKEQLQNEPLSINEEILQIMQELKETKEKEEEEAEPTEINGVV